MLERIIKNFKHVKNSAMIVIIPAVMAMCVSGCVKSSQPVSPVASIPGTYTHTPVPTPYPTCVQEVDFPDANLKAYLQEGLNKPQGPICRSDLESLVVIGQVSVGISDLTGLEWCVNLEHIDFGGNNISDISPIPCLNLSVLYLSDNNITNISSLSICGSLHSLWLENNNISDISSLSTVTYLGSLHLSGNNISDISALSGLEYLWWLDLSNNNISNIDALVVNSDISEPGGLGNENTVDLRGNSLNADAINNDIPYLQSKGIVVYY